jgi:hypothetical protein
MSARDYALCLGSRNERKMAFTTQELNETARKLRSEVGRFLSKPTEPDVLLGNHPLSVFASQKQSIAIWHGRRIEDP